MAEAAATATQTATATPADDVTLLDDAAPAQGADQSQPVKEESKPEAKASGDDKGAPADADVDLLADDDKGTPDEKKADGQADADADKAPETYEAFTLPEGVQIDDAALALATPVFRDLGLDQGKAQKLVDTFVQLQQAAAEQQVAGFRQIKNEWAAEIKADPEFGGDALPKTLGAAKAVIGKFGDKALLNDLKEWGWSNHPGLIRMLAKVNARLSEQPLVTADAAAQSTPKPAWEVLWPGMAPKQE